MDQQRIARALLILRLGVLIVMFVWALDKFVNPAHSGKVFEHFYKISGLSAELFTLLGVLQVIQALAFLVGFKQRISYGLILLLHSVSTLSSWPMYVDAFSNLLFFAAWPMLAACFTLYYLRDMDTLFAVDHR